MSQHAVVETSQLSLVYFQELKANGVHIGVTDEGLRVHKVVPDLHELSVLNADVGIVINLLVLQLSQPSVVYFVL
jgi:hypothetical protein